MSKRPPRCRSVSLMKRGASSTMAAPTGMLTKNTQRQEPQSVSMPPTVRPIAEPAPETAEKTLSARLRSAPSENDVAIRARVLGAASAAAAPWKPRATSSVVASLATPPAIDARVKAATPHTRAVRRPIRSPIRLPSSSRPPKARV